MHSPGNASLHPDAAPSTFAAFKQAQGKGHFAPTHSRQDSNEANNGTLHEFFNRSEASHNGSLTGHWGTFLTNRGIEQGCDVVLGSRSASCKRLFCSETGFNFLAKRRKLNPTSLCPVSASLSSTQETSASLFFDATVSSNAPT